MHPLCAVLVCFGVLLLASSAAALKNVIGPIDNNSTFTIGTEGVRILGNYTNFPTGVLIIEASLSITSEVNGYVDLRGGILRIVFKSKLGNAKYPVVSATGILGAGFTSVEAFADYPDSHCDIYSGELAPEATEIYVVVSVTKNPSCGSTTRGKITLSTSDASLSTQFNLLLVALAAFLLLVAM